ncbi:peptide/nickel transport system permease protein (plasmid) [Ketogulonicigenium robustum]|uniref:Peptide/nickel transport system permease protein n=1 Tax=Ketogulonicigenium robustum TaxID=92947 RepID=A0A1W6P3D0_9RHOB|nr:ABC transporter permease [Ketogulonicigenium robustum]ARO15847.1 peptide/nickel transport system permease protein [Ketogulonicigenium robustum]
MTAEFWLVKIGRMALTIFIVLTFTFIALRTSFDPAQAMLGPDATQREIALFRDKWLLDRSIFEQYFVYIKNALTGDFGMSFRDGRPVTELIAERIPKTLALGAVSYLIAVLVGVPLGLLAALYRGSALDRLVMVFSVVWFALPNFFLGILMILLFSLTLQWLPSSGSSTALHFIMPAAALGLSLAAILARFTRSAMLEVQSKPYMRAAQAKGVPRWRRTLFHALPNAAIPLVTIMGLMLGNLVAGTVVVETVFAWPGVGRLLITAVSSKDMAVVQALVVLVAVSMVTANILVDLSYGLLDPRMRSRS